jgi:hypothetical protein
MADESESCPLPTTSQQPSTPRWLYWSLLLAGIYNLAWGTITVLHPSETLRWFGIADLQYPELWQCIGMIVGVYGIGYWIAASDPARHWPIVLVGLLGKVLGPIGAVMAVADGRLPVRFALVNLSNDLIWWIPFAAALYYAWRTNSAPSANIPPLAFDEALRSVRSQRGRTLGELSSGQTLLLLFVRHAGCTFCREALADLAAQRKELESAGLRLAVVHMSPPAKAEALLARYGLDDLDQFSDPDRRMFRAFELQRGTLWQVFGPAVWLRGPAALLRHGLGRIDGDGFQLAGVFLLRSGRILTSFRHATSADRPDYLALAKAV